MKFLFLFIVFLSSFLFSHEAFVDLEKDAEGFVLESKKIEIPGYPLAFNPSLIRWQGRLLMSFRVIPERAKSFNSDIGLVYLNEQFEATSKPQFLNLRENYPSSVPCRAEDARLIEIKERLYMVYSDNTDAVISKGGFRLYFTELLQDSEGLFYPTDPESLIYFEGEDSNRREKNWVPFEYKDVLLLAYSICPHKIFFPQFGTSTCKTIECTPTAFSWDFGELRGGTPGLPINNEEYLSFFHTSIRMPSLQSEGRPIMHYFMGAYTFSREPPFEVLRVSPRPIVGKGFYSPPYYKHYWFPIRAVFPCGFVQDDDYVWVAFGRQDHEAWITKIDKKALLDSLKELKKY